MASPVVSASISQPAFSRIAAALVGSLASTSSTSARAATMFFSTTFICASVTLNSLMSGDGVASFRMSCISAMASACRPSSNSRLAWSARSIGRPVTAGSVRIWSSSVCAAFGPFWSVMKRSSVRRACRLSALSSTRLLRNASASSMRFSERYQRISVPATSSSPGNSVIMSVSWASIAALSPSWSRIDSRIW